MRESGLALVLWVLAACGAREPTVDHAGATFTEVPVDTVPGLSGLAADPQGGIWTMSERGAHAYRITLAGTVPSVEAYAIEGVPARTDLEGIAYLGGDRFAFGTEGRDDGGATILLAERRGHDLVVTGLVALPGDALGVTLRANNGAEGLCGAGELIVVAIETAGIADGKRWAPVVIVQGEHIRRIHRIWLTTPTGKLSGLDCTVAADGTIRAIAIERHFEVTNVLTFTLPPVGQGSDDVTPAVALDLGQTLHGRLNLEGVARLPDGRVVAVVDNQWKTITGPSELVVFPRGAIP